MNTLSIHIGQGTAEPRVVQVHFPEGYHEWTYRHLAALVRYLRGIERKDELAYMRLVKGMMCIPRRLVKYIAGDQLMIREYTDAGMPVIKVPELEYITEPYSAKRSLVPRIGLLRGPADRLKNMSVEQIGFCDLMAERYAADQSAGNLNLFIGALYRLPLLPWGKWQIDVVALLARLSGNTRKRAAVMNYRGLMMGLKEDYPRVFKGGQKDPAAVYGWEGTIQRLAKTGTFGSYHLARRTRLLQAMVLFEMNAIEVEQVEKNQKQLTKK